MLKNYQQFLNERSNSSNQDYCFDDIEYFIEDDKGGKYPKYSTNDEVTIDFMHLIDPYYEGNKELFFERLDRFNSFYDINLNPDNALDIIPLIEEYWDDESALTIKKIVFMWNNPSKIKDLFRSEGGIKKYDL